MPWGVPDGVGDLNAPPASVPIPEQRVYEIAGEVKAPVLLKRVDPPYPSIFVRTRKSATVVVRCIIDRDGRVRDPQIVVPSLPPFNESVIAAVQQWRYRPGSLHGVAVETYLDVTVHFAVK